MRGRRDAAAVCHLCGVRDPGCRPVDRPGRCQGYRVTGVTAAAPSPASLGNIDWKGIGGVVCILNSYVSIDSSFGAR